MPDETTNNYNTEGGAGIQGNANAGRDFVGRDQNNYYTLLSTSRPEYSIISVPKEQLDALYRKASTAHFQGDLTQAKEYFEQVKFYDPLYPGVSRALLMIKNEAKKPYIDLAGQVRDRDVIIRTHIGDHAQNVTVGKNIIQIGSIRFPLWLIVLVVIVIIPLLIWAFLHFYR